MKDAHPFDDLLAQLVKLARSVTSAVRDESEEGKRLHAYLSLCGLLTHDDVGQKTATLIALRGIYRIVDMAGEKKVRSEREIKAAYDKASGGWVPPLHARRTKTKAKPSSNGKLVSL